MNKYERKLVSTEAFATRLQIVAEGYKTRALICIVAAVMSALFYAVIRDSGGGSSLTFAGSSIAVFVSLAGISYARGVRTTWLMLEESSNATHLRYGTVLVEGEHEIDYNARTGRTMD